MLGSPKCSNTENEINKQNVVEDMKSPKEDYEIHKSVVLDPGTREDLLNFLSFYTLFI